MGIHRGDEPPGSGSGIFSGYIRELKVYVNFTSYTYICVCYQRLFQSLYIEQCTEWQRELCINCIDFEKAFDSIHRDSLWRILRTFGVPPHIMDLFKLSYEKYTCTIGQSDIAFKVKSDITFKNA